jgi:hypothetical protein
MRAGIFDPDHCRSRSHRSDLSVGATARLVDGRLPRRRRERRRELQPPISQGQPPHATHSQPNGQRCSPDQREHLRDCVSPLSPPSGTQPGHRGNRSSTVSPDLVDPAPRSPLRRTRPSRHQTIQAKAHCKNDSATPNSRLSDRTTQSSTQPSTGTVIFDPVLPDARSRSGVNAEAGNSARVRQSRLAPGVP